VDEDRKFSPLVREIRFPGKIAHIHPRPDARSREQRPNHRSHAVGARGRVERGRSGDAGAGWWYRVARRRQDGPSTL